MSSARAQMTAIHQGSTSRVWRAELGFPVGLTGITMLSAERRKVDEETIRSGMKYVNEDLNGLVVSMLQLTPRSPTQQKKSGNHVCSFLKTSLFNYFSFILPPLAKSMTKWGKKYPPFQDFQWQDFQTPILNDSYQYSKNITNKFNITLCVCCTFRWSFVIGINYDTCIMILNENATQINIPLKWNQCMPEDAGWSPIVQFCEIPSFFFFFLNFAERSAQNTPIFMIMRYDSKKYTPFPRNLEQTWLSLFRLSCGTRKLVGCLLGHSTFL